MKQYWEHRQVAEWLEELKTYRAIGTIEEFKALKVKRIWAKAKLYGNAQIAMSIGHLWKGLQRIINIISALNADKL